MAARAVILGCAGPELGPEERRFFAEAAPWGFILFARNVADPGQLRRLTGALRDSVGREAPVLIDQEGGPGRAAARAVLARMGAGARRVRAPARGASGRRRCACATG